MNNRKAGINDPFFSEYVYHCIATASPELIGKLPTQLQTHTHTKLRIKRFADRAPLELKIEMLSRLGVGCAFFFATPEYLSVDAIKEAYKSYKEANRLDAVNKTIANQAFVFTTRDVMAVLGVMGMNCHSESYMLNRDYSRIAAEIANAKDIDKKVKDIELVKSSMQDQKLLCTLLLHNLMNQDFVDNLTGYKARELMLLLYLFVRHRTEGGFAHYTKLETIQKHFATLYDKIRIRLTLQNLYKALHVDKFPERNEYAISGTGIQIITSYTARIVNHTLHF